MRPTPDLDLLHENALPLFKWLAVVARGVKALKLQRVAYRDENSGGGEGTE